MAVDADVLIEHHNSIVRRASVRALELEEKMISVLTPLFDSVANEAAHKFQTFAARQTITAAGTPGVTSTSTMICVKPTPEQQSALAQGSIDAQDIHCTLVYVGDWDDDLDVLRQALQQVSTQHAPLSGEVAGVASFSDNGDGSPSIVLPDVPGLVELRVAVTQALVDAGIDFARDHGFEAHLTIDYTEGTQPPSDDLLGLPLDFTDLLIVRGDEETISMPFTGAKPLTASGNLVAGMEVVATTELGEEVGRVAEEHVDGCLPDYGDCYWHEGEGKVYWIVADYTSSDEIDAGVEAFYEIDGVRDVEACDKCGAPEGDGWERVYGYVSSITASTETPLWTPPPSSALVDVETLTMKLAARMDPVRVKAAEMVMKTALETAPLSRGGEGPSAPNVVSITAAGRRRKPKLGIDYDATNPVAAAILKSSGSQIQSIAEGSRKKVASIVQRGYENGDSIPKVAASLRSEMRRFSPARARLIARTELAGAVNGGSLAATQMLDEAAGGLGVSKVWLTAPGAPNPRHETYDGLNGQQRTLMDTFDVGGDQLQYPGDPSGDPSEVCNCFPAETLVEFPDLRAATRRWYDGEFVRVHFANGDSLAGTPNHPVLRSDGLWTPLRALDEGDHLVSTRLIRNDLGTPDPESGPTEIGEIYRLTQVGRVTEWVRSAPPDFHGDGRDGEIEVVPVEGSLLLNVESASDQEVEEFGFTLAYMARAGSSNRLHALRPGGSSQVRKVARASSLVRGSSEQPPLHVGHAPEAKMVCFGASSRRESEFSQVAQDSFATHAEFDRHREDTLAPVVTLAKIVKVERYTSHGYVFNLDTGEGWYTGNGVISRNCRCAISYTKAGQVLEQATAEDAVDPAMIADQAASGSGEGDALAEAAAIPAESAAAPEAAILEMPDSGVPILLRPTERRPFGHLKESSLNQKLKVSRLEMRRLLGQRTRTRAEEARATELQRQIRQMVRERRKRGGGGIIPARPFAHLSQGQLERAEERATERLKAMPSGRTPKRLKILEERRSLRDEIKYRASRPKRVVTPRERSGARSARGREPATTPPGQPHVLPAPTADRPFGNLSDVKVKSEYAKASKQLSRMPRYATPERVALRERRAQLKREIDLRESTLKAGRRATRVQITREPYSPPTPPKNARMGRLQAAYKRRYDATLVERGNYRISYATDPPSLAEVQAVGADFRKEVEVRMRALLRSISEPTRADEVNARRSALIRVLSEIRPMGALPSTISGESDVRAIAWLRNAAQMYPKDWAGFLGDRRIELVRVGEGASNVRIAKDGSRAVIALNEMPINQASTVAIQQMQGERVALHEMGHVFEHFVPDVADLEAEFYALRSEGEAAVQYAPGSKAIVRHDEWVNSYMGRDYWNPEVGSTDMPRGRAFEILSMGMEAIFTDSYPIWLDDPETANFILGLLVGL